MKWLSFEAAGSVAYKEFLHILRDRRVLLLVLTLPPLFTLLFGHAFETSELTGIKSLLIDKDNNPRSQEFVDIILKNKTFDWKRGSPDAKNPSDLVGHRVMAALVVPAGWNQSLENRCYFISTTATSTPPRPWKAACEKASAIFN